MKKFLVSILGIFLIFGAALLSACGKNNPVLTLSTDTVSIELYSEDEDSRYSIVTAQLSGVKDGSISATVVGGYENIIKVSTSTVSSKCLIRIEGLEEGEGEVVVRANPGNIVKYIRATVYSEVSAMSQKTENANKKENFLMRGEENTLVENKLLTFQPSDKSLRTITWSFSEEMINVNGLELNGNKIKIADTYVGSEVKLVATTEKGVSALVTLPVLDKIENEAKLSFSYSQNSAFEEISEENNNFNIVPNIPNDDHYIGYILVDYVGQLEITPYVLTSIGGMTDDLQVLRADSLNGRPLYSVYASKDKSNINGDYIIGFRIGYANYNYYFDTADICPVKIQAREMVNGINVSTNGIGNIANSQQTIYTNYVEANSTATNGQRFDISITPTTVLDATNKYSIELTRNEIGGQVADGCPIEIFYRDENNGNNWTQIVLVDNGNGGYVTRSEDTPSVKTIYIRASNSLKEQVVEGFELTFRSEDNPNVSTSFRLRLVKSVSFSDFIFTDTDFSVDSSVLSSVYRRNFTLQGQTSIDGLYIINESSNVSFNAIREISNSDDSVTFEVSFSLKGSSYGITSLDSYRIAHRNGLVSDPFRIDIFLPLKYGAMYVGTENNLSNSVIQASLNRNVYSTSGLLVDNAGVNSLSSLILKNNTTTPIIYEFNQVSGISAVANISVRFYDFNSETEELGRFKNLINNEAGTIEIIKGSLENSNVAYFNVDKSAIITKGVGHSYAVVSFTGKGISGADENGNVTYVRIIYIESFVTPDGISVYPDSDKNVNLYSLKSLATSDAALTSTNIHVRFAKPDVTYTNLTNVEFVTKSTVMGRQIINDTKDSIVWTQGRYSISNITVTNEGISFNILAIDTYGDNIFTDTLNIHYVVTSDSGNKIYDIYTPISITIRNAQRIESLKWKNYDEDGLYFEVNNNEPQYLLFDSNPTNAKNTNLYYLITNENGIEQKSFVSVNDTISSGMLATNLSDEIKSGMTGYMYILPADAIYNNQLRYYYMDGSKEKEATISVDALPSNFDFLIANAYFKSNATGGEAKNVNLSDILIKIKITVADGKSFDYAYRIFDVNSFNAMKMDTFYTIMNDLDLTGSQRIRLDRFTGGLQGKNSEITVKFEGNNFARSLEGTVQNITFIGNVVGSGFVADSLSGNIKNVTINVNGRKPSTLTNELAEFVGGIVGENFGTIDSANVLGLKIDGNDKVGGIAGINNGLIKNSRVEFYNLETLDNEKSFATNTFTGKRVGGIVGNFGDGSRIEFTYAYDYTMKEKSTPLKGDFIGAVGGGNATSNNNFITEIINTFSVVGVGEISPNFDRTKFDIKNTYISYNDDTYQSVFYSLDDEDNDFISEGEGFYSYVNGGKAHLKNLKQDQPVSSVSEYEIKTTDINKTNGYYKAVAVDTNKGILFNYSLKNKTSELSSSEENDLRSINTISLSDLVGKTDLSKNIIVTSSNDKVVKVVGSSIQIIDNGDVNLTISSKQDVENSKTINVKVVYALSRLMLSWTDNSGRVSYIQDNSQLTLQKTHSRYYVASFEKSQVFLGTLATAYELETNNGSLNINTTPKFKDNGVEISDKTNAGFRVSAQSTSVETEFEVSPYVFNDETYQTAVENTFTRNFKINPIDGVIQFDISGDNLPLTPSTNASLEVQIKTTQADDNVYPVISYNGNELIFTDEDGNEENVKNDTDNIYYYKLLGQDKPLFMVSVIGAKENSKTEDNSLKNYVYYVNFAVNNDAKALISEDMDFDVYIMSKSGNTSQDWNGEFVLSLTRQNFTNIDVSNRKITGSRYEYINSKLIEVHDAGTATSVLAPGNSSILQINVNPEYAYYDHVDISYSNATVSEAVNIEVLSPKGDSDSTVDQFIRREISGSEVEYVGNALRFYPKAEEKGTLYYKLWINTTVTRDSTLKFTATFYEAGGEVITYVNYYLTISYLAEPTITVDGASVAYLAKGSSAEVKIEVFADQSIDSLNLKGGNDTVKLAQPGAPVIDYDRGTKTYTTRISATVLAEAENNTVYVEAQISRELNGSKEIKRSIATVVIVDFKVDEKSINIDSSQENNVTIWQGVPKPFSVTYNLLPESYGIATDKASEEAIALLHSRRNLFLAAGFYPAKIASETETEKKYAPLPDSSDVEGEETLKDYQYFVNYKYNNENGKLEAQSLLDRLFFVVGNDRYSITDDSIDRPFTAKYNEEDKYANTLSLEGVKISEPVQMVLKTYISAGGTTKEIETFFTVTVEAYSDPDLPLLIKNASEFKALAPSDNNENVSAHDYILTNDIILEEYTPFNTDAIKSLDGNGYTIFIKSFNTTTISSSELNLALFNEIAEITTLKNVRVNLYNGGQITVNTNVYKDINVAGFAITNNGIITNCEVVSFYSTNSAMGDVLATKATTKHNNPSGINIKYIYGNNTDPIYLPNNADWSTKVAGFVLSNTGSITNSRVGGESVIVLGGERLIGGQASGYTYASTQELETFNIIGQGNMAGFVLSNASGNISACFVKRLAMENQSESTNFYSAGFVGINNSNINVSYIEGVPTPESDSPEYSVYSYEGSSITSKMGCVVGFVYRNDGNILDSYSNILIANSNTSNSVYLASGFVYENIGIIENCLSLSQIKNSMKTQMNFSGVDKNGELLTVGTYINCYFFNKAYEGTEEDTDSTTESLNNTGAILIPTPDVESYFYGFAIANDENDGIWKIVDKKGIFLISTDFISISHRYIHYVDEGFGGVTGEDDQGKYILPYATLSFTDTVREIDTSLGGEFNPIIISDAEDFVEVSGTSTSSYIRQYFNNSAMWGTYRLVDDIDLSDIASGDNIIVLPSSGKAFAGTLYGNGFTISGISLSSDQEAVAFGLFKSIERRGRGQRPVIKNLNLEVDQIDGSVVTMSGALAGYIKEAVIISIDINFNNDSSVTALNFAGGLAGFVVGDNIIKCITVQNPNVISKKYLSDNNDEDKFFISDVNSGQGSLQALRIEVSNNLNYNTTINSPLIANLSNYSYAGGLIGFVDIFKTNNNDFDINQAENYKIKNVRINGTIYIEAQIAGGAFGLSGYQTSMRDIGVTIDGGSNSHIIATKYFAGGVVGQSFGSFSRIFAEHDNNTQNDIEDNMGAFYSGSTSSPRGNLDVFYAKGTNYKQQYIGGLVGYAQSGNIEISYSKLNVTSPTANFAGGIVGGLKVDKTTAYQLQLKNSPGGSYYSTYFFNEVFATGDVRGAKMAGGIVGRIIGQSSRVAFQSVNAVNYFTTYNYETGSFAPIGNEGNFSGLYNVNSFVGMLTEVSENGELNDKNKEITADNYSGYIQFIQYKGDGGDSTEGAPENLPSVGYYAGYHNNTSGKSIALNVFGTVSGILGDDNKLYKDSLVIGIESPINYTNASVGYQYTNPGFIGSGAWSGANWEHPMNRLFPSIKYKRSSNILYLDQYNVEEVFMKMNDSSYTVYVRGLESPGSEKYGNINLNEIFVDNGKKIPTINNFQGKIKGGIYPIEAAPSNKVKIITSAPIFNTVGIGFSAIDLTVDFEVLGGKKEDKLFIDSQLNDGNSNAGLFINSGASDITISNLTLNIKNTVVFNLKEASSANIGLVASSLTSSSINQLNINYTGEETIMKIEGDTSSTESSESTLQAGLIAGYGLQESKVNEMKIAGVNLDFGYDIISVAKKFTNYYVGSYFGAVRKEPSGSSLPFYIELEQVAKHERLTTNSGNAQIMFSVSGNIVVGGYFGIVGSEIQSSKNTDIQGYVGVDDINIKGTINTKLGFSISASSENIIAGGIIGSLNSGLRLNGNGSQMDIDLFFGTNVSVNNLTGGGVVGKLQGGTLKVDSFESIEFGVLKETESKESKIDSEKEKLIGSYNESNNVNVTVSANIGGIVGSASSELNVNGVKSINRLSKAADNVNSFRVTGDGSTEVNMGSVLGSTTGIVNISDEIISETEFMIVNAGNGASATANIGGLVGLIQNNELSNISTNSNLIRYDGAVYSDTQSLSFGGMVGKFIPDNDSNGLGNIVLNNTSFGGAVKVYGSNSNSGTIITGGTIGFIKGNIGSTNSADGNLGLTKTYNYGDVFVEYNAPDTENNKFTSLSTYCFGGLIGQIDSNGTPSHKVFDNYSLMTSHNARVCASQTVNALFGKGTPTKMEKYSNNYYSHGVVLANDEFGTDMSYRNGTGYKGYNNSNAENILNVFSRSISDSNNSVSSGEISKLNPGTISGSTLTAPTGLTNSDTFNGMKYYTISGQNAISTNNSIQPNDKGKLENIAIIGDGNTIEYKAEFEQSGIAGSGISAVIEELSGHSFVSSMVLDTDIKYDQAVFNDNLNDVAPLVKYMDDNSMVYAVNVIGTFDVGSKFQSEGEKSISAINVSGIVSVIKGGRIFDCSTDLDIIYRSSENKSGGVYGIAKLDVENGDYGIIENTFASGSIKTYISTNVYAFTNGSENAQAKNCYAINKLDINNYLEETNKNRGIVSVFGNEGGVTVEKCFYDQDALDWNVFEKSVGTLKKRSKFIYESMGDTDKWVANNAFNFGYPTLKYQYMWTSSYARKITSNDSATNTEISRTKLARLKSEGQTFKVEDANNYDNYIQENVYKRLPNATIPDEDGDYYYMIPNAAVLANIDNIIKVTNKDTETDVGLSKKFILKYDIDLSKLDTTTDASIFTTGTANNWNFTGILDGQGHTINGLTRHLFDKVGNGGSTTATCQIVNLRLTNASVSTALLANTITNATISNMTLSGDLKIDPFAGNVDNAIGSLANKAENAEINTVTNLIKIDINSSASLSVGGLVGNLGTKSVIRFSSNYGPINVRTSEDGKTINIGGLVGEMSDASTINYSYNATSVLGNYASNTAASTTQGTFHTGGLVGYLSSGTISNSYNSGIVKSGNKSNAFDKKAYAGGIVGYAVGGKISTCYNEGTVEALGKNPTTKWHWVRNGDDFTLVLYQSSARNVWAYGIGYAENDNIISSCNKIRLNSTNPDNPDSKTIFSNGSSLDLRNDYEDNSPLDISSSTTTSGILENNSHAIQTWSWNNDINSASNQAYLDSDEYGRNKAAIFKDSVHGMRWWGMFVPSYDFWYTRFIFRILSEDPITDNADEKAVVERKTDENGTVEGDIIPISRNSVDIPSTFLLIKNSRLGLTTVYSGKVQDGFEANYDPWHIRNTASSNNQIYKRSEKYADPGKMQDTNKDFNIKSNSIIDELYRGSVGSENTYYERLYDSDSAKLSNKGSGSVNTNDEIEIKQATRSQEEDKGALSEQLSIGGKTYYIANSNNMNTIFASGTYRSGLIDQEFGNILYFDDLNLYNVTVTSGNNYESVKVELYEVNEKNGKAYLNYELISTQPLTGNYEIKVVIDETQKIELSLDKLNYFYYDDYSVGIKIDSINYSKMKNYSLKYTGDNGETITQDNVIRLSKNASPFNDDGTEWADDNENYYYLFYVDQYNNSTGEASSDNLADNNIFMFVPNAKLINSSGNEITVNKIKDSDNNPITLAGDDTFKDNVIKIIDQFKGQIFYSRCYSATNEYVKIESNFSDYKHFEGNFAFGDSHTTDVSLSYGASLGENVFGEPTYADDKFSIELKNPRCDTIGLLDNEPIISYDSINNEWTLKEGIKINYNGVEYSLELDSVQNQLTISAGTMDDSNEFINAIKVYLNNINFIKNDFTNTQKVESNFTDQKTYICFNLDNNTIEQYDVLPTDKANRIVINRELNYNWTLEDNKLIYSKDGTGYSVMLNETEIRKLESIKLGNVEIFKGTAQTSLIESYTSTILKTLLIQGVGNNGSEKGYYEFKIENENINISTRGFVNLQGSTSDLYKDDQSSQFENLSDEFKISATYFPTMTTDAIDGNSYDYKLLLKDKEGQQYYINAVYNKATETEEAKLDVNNISLILVGKDNKKILLDITKIKSNERIEKEKDEQGNEVEAKITNTCYNFTICGVKILDIIITDKEKENELSTTISYKTYFDHNGNSTYEIEKTTIKELVEESEEGVYKVQEIISIESIYVDTEMEKPKIEYDPDTKIRTSIMTDKREGKSSQNLPQDIYFKVDSKSTRNLKDFINLDNVDNKFVDYIESQFTKFSDILILEEEEINESSTRKIMKVNTAIKGDYKVEKEIKDNYLGYNYKDDEKTVLQTSLRVNAINYQSLVAPVYKTSTITFNYGHSVMIFPRDEILSELYEKDSKNLEVYLRGQKDNKLETLLDFEAELHSEDTCLNTVNKGSCTPTNDIILTQDISFTHDKVISVKLNEYNIIGNGYNISYYNKPFIGELTSGRKGRMFISNLNFLGEVCGEEHRNNVGAKSLIIGKSSTVDDSLSLYKINLYGSSINATSNIINGNENIRLTDFNSYASIDVKINNSTLFTNCKSDSAVTNKGFIITANGADNSIKQYKTVKSAGLDGGIGICLNTGLTTMTNAGLIIKGSGGNGGSGSIAKFNSKAFDGGAAGSEGSISGVSSDTNTSNQAFTINTSIAGKSGGVQRATMKEYFGDKGYMGDGNSGGSYPTDVGNIWRPTNDGNPKGTENVNHDKHTGQKMLGYKYYLNGVDDGYVKNSRDYSPSSNPPNCYVVPVKDNMTEMVTNIAYLYDCDFASEIILQEGKPNLKFAAQLPS